MLLMLFQIRKGAEEKQNQNPSDPALKKYLRQAILQILMFQRTGTFNQINTCNSPSS